MENQFYMEKKENSGGTPSGCLILLIPALLVAVLIHELIALLITYPIATIVGIIFLGIIVIGIISWFN